MRILYGGESDEIVHRLITDGEWGIVLWIVLTMNRMIKVITK